MAEEYERQRHDDRVIATMYRLDPDKLAAVRRAVSGITRCPECDEKNPADQKRCYKCGAKLYPDMKDDEDEEAKKAEQLEKEEAYEEPPYKID